MRCSCLHTHTDFCDGTGSIEDFCRAAWEKGFESIGFSSHGPLPQKTGLISVWHMKEDRLPEYIEEVREARRRWEGRLRVFLGLEVDYLKGLTGPADRDIQNLGLDFIIGSVHYVFPPQGGKPFTVDDSAENVAANIREKFGGDGEAVMEAYWDAVEGMIRAGGFDILGHLDLIKKNNAAGRWFSPADSAYTWRAERAADLAAGSGAVVEVNTGGINRGSIRETYPSPAILGLLKDRGVPVTISADAHRPEHLGGYYGQARQCLLEAGYGETLFFEGRENGKALWTREKLIL